MVRELLSFNELGKIHSSERRYSDLQSLIRKDLQRLNISKPENLIQLDKLIILLAMKGPFHEMTEQGRIHQHLIHQWQVKTVAEQIILNSNADAIDKTRLLEEANLHSKLHDSGRGYSMREDHPEIGKIITQELRYENKYADFAVDHHRWGFHGAEGRKHLKRIRQGEIGEVFEEMFQVFNDKYGLAGIAVLIADNSKLPNYDSANEYEKHTTGIAKFTRKLGEYLIEVQLGKKRFEKLSDEHIIEMAGVEFILFLINKIRETYNVDYDSAINKAQNKWPSQALELINLWFEVRETELREDYS